MRHEFSIQTINLFASLPVQEPLELTLEQKVMLANHPAVKSMLEKQLEVEKAKIASENVQTYQKFVQEGAEDEAKKMGIKPTFQIFLHPDETGQKCIKLREGLIVHIHIDCNASYIVSKEFWTRLRSALSKVPGLTRSSALLVRAQYWEQRNELVPSWKKIKIENELVEFNLLSDSSYSTTEEIKIVKKHKATGLMVIVSGLESERASLEREALVLLSQQVALFNHSVTSNSNEND